MYLLNRYMNNYAYHSQCQLSNNYLTHPNDRGGFNTIPIACHTVPEVVWLCDRVAYALGLRIRGSGDRALVLATGPIGLLDFH